MSNVNGSNHLSAKPPLAAFRKRAPFYAIAIVAGIVALAYIDGGEEPLHLIVQDIAVTQVSADVG